jgi:hypothetical protein
MARFASACSVDRELVAAIARRFDARTISAGAFVIAVLAVVGGMGLISAAWAAPLQTALTRLVETAVTGAFVFVAVVAADELVARGAPRARTYAIAILSAALIGAVIGWYVRSATGLTFRGPPTGGIAGPLLNTSHRIAYHLTIAIACSLVAGLATFVWVSRRNALAARQRQQDAERARAQARRRTLESELQALQARVEPMFLFDTLERIRAAYRLDAAVGNAMMEDLIVYLRAALPHLRESTSTVAQELRLVGAWLDIVGRGAQGFATDLDAAPSVHDARLPALVLLPIVQCAVGGAAPVSLRLRVREQSATRLSIDISTSSGAFAVVIADDPRLQQIGNRLRALYGDDARFACGVAEAGSEASVELPLERDQGTKVAA